MIAARTAPHPIGETRRVLRADVRCPPSLRDRLLGVDEHQVCRGAREGRRSRATGPRNDDCECDRLARATSTRLAAPDHEHRGAVGLETPRLPLRAGVRVRRAEGTCSGSRRASAADDRRRGEYFAKGNDAVRRQPRQPRAEGLQRSLTIGGVATRRSQAFVAARTARDDESGDVPANASRSSPPCRRFRIVAGGMRRRFVQSQRLEVSPCHVMPSPICVVPPSDFNTF